MKRCVAFILLLLMYGQSELKSQTLDEARELYKVGEFQRALPVFQKEFNAKPTDASLNHWYGVCLFETNGDISKAEEYLTFAAKKGIQDAYLYLGKIYTKTYRFNEASRELDIYAKLKKKDKEALARIEQDKERLSFFKKAVLRTEDIQIIDSLIVDKSDFLAAYKLSSSSGYLDYFNNFFEGQSPVESTVYSNEKKTKIYYGKPADETAYTLFSMEKLLNGFSNEKKLSDNNFDLSGNSNYPFVLSDGVTIYFSAEDKNGLGGYDIYITRYNMNNDTYLTPERLNMPFNSIFNDYLMVVDEEKGVGWFATDRFQPNGKVCIYTFIPNENVVMLENADESYLARRARISSIKDSWKPQTDYTKLITLARKNIVVKKEIAKDFDFVINDQYTYYKYDDFKDQKAKDMYRQVVDLTKNMRDVETQLDTLRASYSSNRSTVLANKILELENKQSHLFFQIKELEISTRAQEIRSLNR